MSSSRSKNRTVNSAFAVVQRGDAPLHASKLPPFLRFPLLVVLSLSLSSLLYSLNAVYGTTEKDLAGVSRRLESWWEVGALVGWRTFELGLGWFGDYDGYDLAALSLLSHGPPAYLLGTFYEVRTVAVISSLIIDALTTYIPFRLLRPLSLAHAASTSSHSVAVPNRDIVTDTSVQILTTLLAASIYSVTLYSACASYLPVYLVTYFSNIPSVTAAHTATPFTLFPITLLLGLAAKSFIFTPAAASVPSSDDAKNVAFNPESATLADTLWYNVWGYSTKTKSSCIAEHDLNMALIMASDASRRWLDDSGIWSCRIKLPQSQSQADSQRAAAQAQAQAQAAAEEASQRNDEMAPAEMDVPLQSTSPSSRRNKGKLAEAIQSMAKLNNNLDSLELPTDPDAQATVTDFLDFTEYLPSDMIRSLTLIGNLDNTYSKASYEVHDLTKLYGQLPSLPADKKPDPTGLRAEISQNLGESLGARTASYAEACRMVENVERHYNRIKNIHAKLQSIADAYPPSREASPVQQKTKSPVLNRAPKITLRVDRGAADGGAMKVRKHRAPRITVPGEVLAPYELDYESYGSDSDDSSEDQFVTPRETPARSLNGNNGKIRLKIPKLKREKSSKPPRENRPPGFGTNVHSQVAGISTSNALRLLAPPPADAKPGSEHLPWLALSEYELGLLRKKMKKNAVWSPSDTMINRELKSRGRGLEAYRAAVAAASAKGETIEVPPQLNGQQVTDKGALSAEAANKPIEEEAPLMNRGMKLNEAKKLKRENQKKELEAAEEGFEEAQRKVGNAKAAMENLFGASDKVAVKEEKKSTAKTPSKTPARKRKRDPEPETEVDGEKPAGAESVAKPARPLLKRSKTETPVPVPQPISTKQATPAATPAASEAALSVVSETAPIQLPLLAPAPATAITPAAPQTPVETPTESVVVPIPVPIPSPKKSSTPILPPVREPRRTIKKEVRKIELPTATSDRPRRGSLVQTPITPVPPSATSPITVPIPAPITAPAPEALPPKRPSSSRSKAASIERDIGAAAATDRPRRASTARNTPAPEPRQPSKRTKRPAPGVVTKGPTDSTAVSVGRRSAATRKKAGPKREKKDGREGSAAQEIYDEVDDEGNIIDPNEPRYCLCNRVSFGMMIGCENGDCDKEWFHLEVTLGIGEKGEQARHGNGNGDGDYGNGKKGSNGQCFPPEAPGTRWVTRCLGKKRPVTSNAQSAAKPSLTNDVTMSDNASIRHFVFASTLFAMWPMPWSCAISITFIQFKKSTQHFSHSGCFLVFECFVRIRSTTHLTVEEILYEPTWLWCRDFSCLTIPEVVRAFGCRDVFSMPAAGQEVFIVENSYSNLLEEKLFTEAWKAYLCVCGVLALLMHAAGDCKPAVRMVSTHKVPSLGSDSTRMEAGDTKNHYTSDISPGDQINSESEPAFIVDHHTKRAPCRKFDFRLLPVLAVMYLFSALDKGNLGNAKADHLEDNLHFKGNQYNIILSAFYIPYGMIGKKYGPAIVLPIMITAYNFSGIIALRWFLGMAESAFFPLVIYYLTTFYRRGELARRLAIFYAAINIANAFSRLLAYGVFRITNTPLYPWRYLFLVEGSLTFLFAIFAFFYLPKNAAFASFLNESEKTLAYHRIQVDSSSVVNEKFDLRDSLETFLQPTTYAFLAIEICFGVHLRSVSLFLPQIVARLGYSAVKTNLHTVAPNVTGVVMLLILAFSSDFTRRRGPFVVLGFIFTFVGFAIYATIDVLEQKHIAYFATFMMCWGTSAPSVLLSTWYNNNTPSEGRRIVLTSVGVPLASVMGLVSSNIFTPQSAPKYIPALATTAAFGATGALLAGLLSVFMTLDNKRRDRKLGRKLNIQEVPTEQLRDGPSGHQLEAPLGGFGGLGSTSTAQPQAGTPTGGSFGGFGGGIGGGTGAFGSTSRPPASSSTFGTNAQPASQAPPTNNPLATSTSQGLQQSQQNGQNHAYFDSILERSRKRMYGQTDGDDLPHLQLGLGDLRQRIKRLAPGPQDRSVDGKAHYLLAASGVDPGAAIRDLNLFNTGAGKIEQRAPVQQPVDTDVEGYLANLQTQTTLSMISDGLARSIRDFDTFLEDNVTMEWDAQRKRIYQHFGIKPRESPVGADRGSFTATAPAASAGFGRSRRSKAAAIAGSRASGAAGISTFGRSSLQKSAIGAAVPAGAASQQVFADVTQTMEQNGVATSAPADRFQRNKQGQYAEKVQNLNLARLHKRCYPVCHEFARVVETAGEQHGPDLIKAYKAFIEIISENPEVESLADSRAVKERQFAGLYLDERAGANPEIRKKIIRGGTRCLEKLAFEEVESVISKNPREANLGGIPNVISKVKAYVRFLASKKRLSGDNIDLQMLGDDYVWALIYYLLRTGHIQEIIQRLRRDLQDRINNEYNQRLRIAPENSIDPYRMACYKIIGRCDLRSRNIEGISHNVEDFVWLQLVLAREVNRVDEIASEVYGLADLQKTMREIGARFFIKGGAEVGCSFGAYVFFQVACGMFEEAVAYLYSYSYADGVHLATVMGYYGLLRVSNPNTSGENLLTRTVRDNPQINFGRMVGYYTRDFRAANVGAAVDYLVLICLNEDLPGQLGASQVALCHDALRELVLESREFALLLGDIYGSGQRSAGLVAERVSLIGLSETDDFMRTITIQAASAADDNGRTTDAALLYYLAEEFDNVIVIVNRALSEFLVVPIGQNPILLQPLKPNPQPSAGDIQTGSMSLASIDSPKGLAITYKEIFDRNRAQRDKIKTANYEACELLLKIALVRVEIENENWGVALDLLEKLEILPLLAKGNASEIRNCAARFSSYTQPVASTVPNLIMWTILCTNSIQANLRNSGFSANEGSRQLLMQEMKQKNMDLTTYTSQLRYRFPAHLHEALARAQSE
ncbi:hypothetical protein G7Y89_g10727 [Cudoniella acicularis]|uniref:Inhibitor of growth protein N-terminal histone-binding domain-containing protein n=1 Tax=Cudoniella acicularis TaxID=354080 RepID=A0A8H4RDA1_9HELO|nr:hypothetical protein G7Y89_g10727 [Cudoniella acicularis]